MASTGRGQKEVAGLGQVAARTVTKQHRKKKHRKKGHRKLRYVEPTTQ